MARQPTTPKLEPLNLSRERGEKSACMHAKRSLLKPYNVMTDYEPNSKSRHSSVQQECGGYGRAARSYRSRSVRRCSSQVYQWPTVCVIPVPVPQFCFYDFMFGGTVVPFIFAYHISN